MKCPFDALVRLLRVHNYKVEVSKRTYWHGKDVGKKHFQYACVSGKKIIAGFCSTNEGQSYSYINNQIAADHADCFDKWSKCGLILPLPQTPVELEYLLKKLKWLGTKKGFNASNNFEVVTA